MLGYYRAPELTAPQSTRMAGSTPAISRGSMIGANLYIAGRTKELITAPASTSTRPRSRPCSTPTDWWCSPPSSAAPSKATKSRRLRALLPGATLTAADLQAYSARQLTSYKRPSEIVILDALPAASTGKILKHKLKETAIARGASATSRRSASG